MVFWVLYKQPRDSYFNILQLPMNNEDIIILDHLAERINIQGVISLLAGNWNYIYIICEYIILIVIMIHSNWFTLILIF